jgi:thiamine kinase-like enzyme
MLEFLTNESEIAEHPAVVAWRQLSAGYSSPKRLEFMQERRKSSVYKLAGVGQKGVSVIAKRCKRANAEVERIIYEEILPHAPIQTLGYYGCVSLDEKFSWLFVEDAGEEAYLRSVESHRILAGRWLATVHGSAAKFASSNLLPSRTENYYLELLRKSAGVIRRNLNNPLFVSDNRNFFENLLSQLELLEGYWGQIKRFCDSAPRTLVHSDFVAKNLRVRSKQSNEILLPFDWDFAGWGEPTTDLAQFTKISASPDLGAYHSIITRYLPQLSRNDVDNLAKFGMIFRLIAAINWSSVYLEEGTKDVKKFLSHLTFYQEWLEKAIQSVKWGTRYAKNSADLFPALNDLNSGLSEIFNDRLPHKDVSIISRNPHELMSSFASEVVECLLPDGSRRNLFCKYAGKTGQNVGGHRGGVKREAAVYQYILQPLQVSVVPFYGAFTDKSTGEDCLVLENLDQCCSVNSDSISLAARWIGQFHKATEACVPNNKYSFLKTYDAEYYSHWARQTTELIGEIHPDLPWLRALCERFVVFVSSMLEIPKSVIHGEYYFKNILTCNDVIYPVDWESAAIAFGEIDLAALIEGRWSAETVEQCKTEYQKARWGAKDVPDDFEQRLDRAKLYLHFRWLGDRLPWQKNQKRSWRFEDLRLTGERLGLL